MHASVIIGTQLWFVDCTAVLEATVSSLRSMLLDREQQLGRLEADLAVACSAPGCSQRLMTEAAQNDSALRIEVNVLKRRLSEKEAQIISSEERLSHLEAVHRVAQVCQCSHGCALYPCAVDHWQTEAWHHNS